MVNDEQHKCLFTEQIDTPRLMLKASVMAECSVIQAINEASDYIEHWVGWKTPKDYAYKTLTDGNLPPGGDISNFRAMTIYLKETSDAIGVLELYCGFPDQTTLLLGWLFIHPAHQKHGYALETVNQLAHAAKLTGFEKIRLGVHLKNWPALRFWHKAGFDKIAGFLGDELYSENTYASVILEKPLEH